MYQRDEAWKVARIPYIGRWKFLGLTDLNDPRYRQVLFRLSIRQSRDALLDLGCGLGQALRQFRADGVNGSQLFAIDAESRFIESGYSLFQDRHSLNATFLVGDMVDPDDTRPSKLNGLVTIIHAGSFFHLFSWSQQLHIGKQLVGFLKPGTKNALIYGRQAGTSTPRDVLVNRSSPYLHNQESFQRLWDDVGSWTGTKWKVEMEDTGSVIPQLVKVDKTLRSVNFTIYQIP